MNNIDFFTGKTKLYSNIIFTLAQNSILKISKKEKKELEKILGNVIFNRDGSKFLKNRTMKRDDQLASKLFKQFSEIYSSYDVIQNIPVYIKVFTFQKKGMSKYSHFRYHIENYLNELYILEQRLKTYLTIITRLYRKSNIKPQLDLIEKELSILITKTFANYKAMRRTHVHESRFTDEDLDRLSFFDTLSKSQDKEFVKNIELLYKMAYREIQKKWKKRFINDIKCIHKLNETYLDYLYKTITKNGILINPWKK